MNCKIIAVCLYGLRNAVSLYLHSNLLNTEIILLKMESRRKKLCSKSGLFK